MLQITPEECCETDFNVTQSPIPQVRSFVVLLQIPLSSGNRVSDYSTTTLGQSIQQFPDFEEKVSPVFRKFLGPQVI